VRSWFANVIGRIYQAALVPVYRVTFVGYVVVQVILLVISYFSFAPLRTVFSSLTQQLPMVEETIQSFTKDPRYALLCVTVFSPVIFARAAHCNTV
jgi:hypothetical protein